MDVLPIKRALLSTSDKSGLLPLAKSLARHGCQLLSTGGTARHLFGAGLRVTDIATYTGFPEMLDGRVKTLHPRVFAGILARRSHEEDARALADHGIATIDLVVVNLYPFARVAAQSGAALDAVIEEIDIGGPSLIRAAAKNYTGVAVATDPAQYDELIDELETHGGVSLALRERLMRAAFEHTARYDRVIADYFAERLVATSPPVAAPASTFPAQLSLDYQLAHELRYGENPHQPAALYRSTDPGDRPLVAAGQHGGKPLSYNNLLDLEAAVAIVREFSRPAAAVIKHNNPCGAALGTTPRDATQAALAGDPDSAFGGVLALNQPLDEATAEFLADGNFFIEVIGAPRFDSSAFEILTTRPKWKKNVRLVDVSLAQPAAGQLDLRPICGGLLVQHIDTPDAAHGQWQTVTRTPVPDELAVDLDFAWRIVRHVRSNAIVLARHEAVIGVGAGQMSRVDSVEIAIRKAGSRAAGAVMASDAFFPFADSIERAAAAGIRAVIQPGGSMRDQDSIAACDQHAIAMIFTGRRHFRH
jgi:phosphoribosylaminoimidazolecarboxamide formyltransferase/IMP cyclohydrolase